MLRTFLAHALCGHNLCRDLLVGRLSLLLMDRALGAVFDVGGSCDEAFDVKRPVGA